MSGVIFDQECLSQRLVLVTGASSGIGRGVAEQLSRCGARVVCHGRDVERLEEAVRALDGKGHAVMRADLSDLGAIGPAIRELCRSAGPLHGIVHAAGVQEFLPLQLLSEDKLGHLLTVNAEACALLLKAMCQPGCCRKEGGSFVAISSAMGSVGAPGQIGYSMSKGAVEAFVRSAALELARRRIRVNAVAPAFVDTPLFQARWQQLSEGQREAVLQAHPLGIGDVDDVAQAAVYLLADSGRWVTGTTLHVDGGYTAM